MYGIIKADLLEFQQNQDTWKLLSFPWMPGVCFVERNGSAGSDGGNPAVWQVDRLDLLCQGRTQGRAGKPHPHPATSWLPPAAQEHCVLCAAG